MSEPSVRVAHAVEGRIRLKVRHGKGNPEALEAFAATFRGLPGIEAVETNPVTGTVVLTYDPDRHGEFVVRVDKAVDDESRKGVAPKTDMDKLADVVEEEAEFLAQHSHSARVFVDSVKRLDREIKVRSGNNVDLKIVLASGVVAAMFLEIGATAATPVWVTLLLFGANHFVELHSKGETPRGAGASRPARRRGNGVKPIVDPGAPQHGPSADGAGAGI